MRRRKYKVIDNIYDIELTILVCSEKNFCKYVESLGEKCKEENCEGSYIKFEDKEDKEGERILWVNSLKTLEDKTVLAHELLHATFEILSSRGIFLTRNNNSYTTSSEETYCYYYGFLYKLILNKIKNKEYKKM